MDQPLPNDALEAPTAWYATRRFRMTALWAGIIVAAVEGYFAIVVRDNDFGYHRNTGAFLLEGDPYRPAGNCYPLGRVLMNVPLALVNVYVARAVCYLLALAALWACFRMWGRMASGGRKPPDSAAIDDPRSYQGAYAPRSLVCAAGVLAAALVFPFVLRDLDECGLQIFMLFMLTAAGYAVHRGRSGWAGFWLGTAITYKMTPVLCLPLLVWKRQWRAVGWSVIVVAVWAALPATVLGWGPTLHWHQEWWKRTSSVAADGGAYPSVQGFHPGQGTIEAAKQQNLSLQAALARYLETYPPGHPLHLDHPAFFQFGALEPRAAQLAVKGVLIVLACALAWRFRRRWAMQDGDLPAEWAAACLLCAVVSPFCWKQHLVMVLPALFLTIRSLLGAATVSRWRIGALALIGAIVLLSRRGIVGHELSILLLSYKADTLAMMVALLLVLTLPAGVPKADATSASSRTLPKPHANAVGTQRRHAANAQRSSAGAPAGGLREK